MKTIKYSMILIVALASLMACNNTKDKQQKSNLKDTAYEAFIYAYPLMEQVKTMNGMFEFMGLKPNVPAMSDKFPMETVGQPIVAPNLTSMTGGILIDISNGPVTLEIPEVKDRYIVYQCIDVFTHNFYYMGTQGNNGEAGQFTFYNKHQKLAENSETTPVLMEQDLALIVLRIDIKDRSELDHVREIMSNIKVVDAPAKTREYPTYDEEKAYSPLFVEYVNELLTEIPESETEEFKRFASIGIMNEVNLSEAELAEVQAGIDSAYIAIEEVTKSLEIGNGYISATGAFGSREFLNKNYLIRAAGAKFGLWGNSQDQASYFMFKADGEGELRFEKDELPPLSDVGFWSITVHDKDGLVHKNEFDSYVLTMDQMKFNDDGSLVLKISPKPEEGNWLYTTGDQMVVWIRAYQADPEKIGTYVPPAFVERK
jgi:hypothetical protein